MGYDASVYLIYGVRIKYDADTPKDELISILKIIVPDLLEKYGEEDVFGCLDDEPHAGGYYCLNFDDQDNKSSEMFIACYFHEHVTARGADGSLEVKMPSKHKRKEFKEWLVEKFLVLKHENALSFSKLNINEKPKFYTKLYESY